MYYYKLNPSISEWIAQQSNSTDLEFLLHPDLAVPSGRAKGDYSTWLEAYPNDNYIATFQIPLEHIGDRVASDFIEPIAYDHSTRGSTSLIIPTAWSIRTESNIVEVIFKDVDGYDKSHLYLKPPELVQADPSIPDDTIWSDPKTIRIDFHADYVKEQIRTRYAFLHRPSSGVLNPVVDTYFPQMYYNYGSNVSRKRLHKLPSTAVAISPFIANAFNIKQMSVEQMCLVLGFDKKTIRKLLTDVKHHKYHFAFIGAGGTSINTAHWMSEMCKMVNIANIFDQVSCFEADTAEVSNLLRFPIDPRTILAGSSRKLDLMSHVVSNLAPSFQGANHYVPHEEPNGALYYPSSLYTAYNSSKNRQARANTILYGAPTIETRDYLSKHGHFICATHANTNCSIWLNPKQELENSVESYGMIQLAPFFMNQLRMAIETLQILAPGDLDLMEQDVQLFGYQFDGTIVGKPDRTYNWQIQQDSLVATEESAILGDTDV